MVRNIQIIIKPFIFRKRRGQQLKRWAQREREYALKRKAAGLSQDQVRYHEYYYFD